MSLLGALNSSISGLTAQSTAFSNISENVANAQTVGYKQVDTNFVDYLTTSNNAVNEPGAVVARPDYANSLQGAVTQTANPLNLAIAGAGFFPVSQPTGTVNNITTFSPQQFYTRAGDFQINANGYMVNSAGLYLNGCKSTRRRGRRTRTPSHPFRYRRACSIRSRPRPCSWRPTCPPRPPREPRPWHRRSHPISTSTIRWVRCTPWR